MSTHMDTFGLGEYEGAVQQKIRLHWGEGSMNLKKRLEDPLFRALYIVACEQERGFRELQEALGKCSDLVQKLEAMDPTAPGAFFGSVHERLDRVMNQRSIITHEEADIVGSALEAAFEDRDGWRKKIAKALRVFDAVVLRRV